MKTTRKDLIRRLLEGMETGVTQAADFVDKSRFVGHSSQTPENGGALAARFERLAAGDSRVKVVRVFEDGDFVFAHAEYAAGPSVGFEIFRFEGDRIVEHWDNIQPHQGPNPSGHSMVDGQTKLLELEKTESNREIVQSFIEDVLIRHEGEKIYEYVKWNHFVEHNPQGSDDLDALIAVVSPPGAGDAHRVRYDNCQRVLAEGNFVLSVCQGSVNEARACFYDLWCLEHDYVVEHWDTTRHLPSPE